MADKCECEGLSIAMEILASNGREGEEEARQLVWDIFSQLSQPYKMPINSAAVANGGSPHEELQRLTEKLTESDPIKQMMTCGPVLTEENMTDATKALKKAFDLLKEGKSDEAAESLKSHIATTTCSI